MSSKIFIFDIDGTLVPHLGAQMTREIKNRQLGARIVYQEGHLVIVNTGRDEKYRAWTVKQLDDLGIKYHHLIMGKASIHIVDDDHSSYELLKL